MDVPMAFHAFLRKIWNTAQQLTPVNPQTYNTRQTRIWNTNKKCYQGDNPLEVTY